MIRDSRPSILKSINFVISINDYIKDGLFLDRYKGTHFDGYLDYSANLDFDDSSINKNKSIKSIL
jgi:hypothetical protein